MHQNEPNKFNHLSDEILKLIKAPEVQNLLSKLAHRNKHIHLKDIFLFIAIFGGLALYYHHIIREDRERRADRLEWVINSKQKIMALVGARIQEVRQVRQDIGLVCTTGKKLDSDHILKWEFSTMGLEYAAFASLTEFDESVHNAILEYIEKDQAISKGCEGSTDTSHLANLMKAEELMNKDVRNSRAELSALLDRI